ncbi:MAG TPA: HAMP domain-containing sensor histidine kinase [Acidimicrobiales bacterium]|nr:HAMP domain-containing sensor histidine kinase [Acidimicrobiales bacterium]
MRRRLSLTMAAMVVAALVFAGLATLGLTVLNSVHQTQAELVVDAKELAQGIDSVVATDRHHDSLRVLRSTLGLLNTPLKLQGEAVLAITPDGSFVNLFSPGPTLILPSGLSAKLLESNLQAFIVGGSQPVNGHIGRLAWAALSLSPPVPVAGLQTIVVVLTRESPAGVGTAAEWFGLASLLTVIVALVAANRLGHRIARPLQQTEAVTRRIATGDLEARVPVTAQEWPELVSLANSVNQMASSLSRAQGTQRQFLMSVSHDLRTPLTSIRGFAEALSDGATTDVTYAAGIIGSSARRLERLVTDLLELAKLESGAFSLHSGALDLSDVVSQAAQAFEPAASALGLSIELEAAGTAEVLCVVDPDRVGQVVANLVENALKYATSRVTVGTRRISDGWLEAFVEDDGPGIPWADLERVFERLYQSRLSAGRELGSGLGLAIVDELVKAMGGQVRAESPTGPNGGTRVVVVLPAASSVAG